MKISVYHFRRLLWASCLVFGAASVASLIWGGLSFAPELITSSSRSTAVAKPAPESWPALATFVAAASMDLQRPLFDGLQRNQTAPPLAIKLTGTVIDPGHSQALLLTPEGRMEFKGVGDLSGGALIQKIEPDAVEVLYNGQTVILTVKKAQGN